jgi:hypothetical protein
MDFEAVLQQLKDQKIAACRYEQEGHCKFRDCVLVGKNRRLVFQCFSWGEAAGLVFEMGAAMPQPGEDIVWNDNATTNLNREETPKRLTGFEEGALLFDGLPAKWSPKASYKWLPKELKRRKPLNPDG